MAAGAGGGGGRGCGGAGAARRRAGRTSAASASILLTLESAATVALAALAALAWREHVGRNLAAGAALVVGAGAVLVWEPGAEVSIGALLIALACVAWAFDNGVTVQIDQLSPEYVVLAKGAIAGAANLTLGVLLGRGDEA